MWGSVVTYEIWVQIRMYGKTTSGVRTKEISKRVLDKKIRIDIQNRRNGYAPFSVLHLPYLC